MLKKVKRKPTFVEAILPIIFMVLALVVGKGKFKFPTEICLLSSAIFAGLIAYWRLGMSFDEMQNSILEKIVKVMPSILIVWCVALLVASWMYSGTIPMLVYYGMQIVSPKLMLVAGFIIAAILSMFTGSSWSSAATAGVALMGIAQGLNVPLPQAAGAIIGGAYFGDKLSPLSDTTNLASAISEVDLYDHIRNMLYTTIPATIITLIIYFFMGRSIADGSVASAEVSTMLAQLNSMFDFNIILILPVLIILAGSLMKMPTLPVMIGSGFTALLLGVLYQNFDLLNGLNAMMTGFNTSMTGYTGEVLPKVIKLLNRGGLKSQGGFLTFIFSAMIFAGIMGGSGMLDRAIGSLSTKIKSVPGAVFAVMLSCFGVASMTGSGGLTIVIPGEMFRKIFIKLKLHPLLLSRTLEDSGTLIMPIIPWTAAGLYMTSTLGVSTTEYLPYTFFCYLSMVFAMVYAFTGFSIKKLTDEEIKSLEEQEA